MVETYESYDLPDFNDPDIPLKEVLEMLRGQHILVSARHTRIRVRDFFPQEGRDAIPVALSARHTVSGEYKPKIMYASSVDSLRRCCCDLAVYLDNRAQ
jgi:hypothetical protein